MTKKITGRPKKKGGAPTKFNDEVQRQTLLLAKKGFTDKEVAEVLGVTQVSLGNWKKAHPEFFESLKKIKKDADRAVERSLYERACGYECVEDKIFNNGGKALVVETIKHYPPDPVSMIFWLKNRQPGKWRDKTEQVVDFKNPPALTINFVKANGEDKS